MASRSVLNLRTMLLCGVLAGPLFILVFVILGQLTDGYDPVRHRISTLALGEYGIVQRANFIVAGLLTLAFAAGVRGLMRQESGTTWGPLLIGVWSICSIGAGFAATDPMNGFPPGTPARVEDPSGEGVMHSIFAGFGLFSLLVAHFVFARWFGAGRERGWALFSATFGVIFAISIVLASYGFGRTEGLGEISGLLQRIAIIVSFMWLTVISIYFFATRTAATDGRPGGANSARDD